MNSLRKEALMILFNEILLIDKKYDTAQVERLFDFIGTILTQSISMFYEEMSLWRNICDDIIDEFSINQRPDRT
ncbi:MAG: hypothetical protein ACTSRA_00610 [Promethearchaeota archaeon]|nr:MAG: hypothetical protein [Helarchaeota virus Nidhogg Meg22_1012]URC17459.1 MAG: hypothetical protein [Helarchaeota virus Nidhogg Meg22_1214]